ncbi:hypothetical protein BH10PSE15_BH10PSE15_09820 [soil metagenome]
MKTPSAQGSTLRPDDSQAVFLDDLGPAWRRTRIGLWLYAGLGVLRIIGSGVSLVVLRR